MSKLRLIAMILGVILLAIPSVARAQATPTKIKLLTQNTGWALMRGRLFWTTDFGQDWRDITPPLATSPSPHGAESIVNVFFLDTRSGWALLRRAWGKYNDWSFDLASTDDSGITWSILPVDLPNWLQWEELSGGGAIDFVDSAHGWMNLSLASSTNFARGLLYSTADGGRTWRSVSKAPMIAAEVRFTTLDDGWLAGGPAGQDLYSTHDGGKGWKRVNLAAPSKFGQVGLPTYWPPIFTDPKHGSVIVSYERGGFVAFSTSDGGRMWKTIAALSGISPTRAWASVVDSSLVVGRILKGSSLVLIQAGPHEQTRRAVAAIQPGQGTVRHLSFRGNQVGWALANGRLYSTTNAGESWKDVTPKLQPSRAHTMNAATSRAHTAQQASPVDLRTATGAAGPSGKGVGSIHTSAHLGFDSCTAPATGDMGAWWTTSPYYDVGFYLGGSNTHCSLGSQYPPPGSPDPTPAQWVSIVANQGWGVVPIWVGPQAPYNTCTTGYATYVDTDPATAQTQGEDEADAAVSAASGLGLTTGSIIYYDMELYDQANSTCQGAVADFLMGWDYELHSQGYKAGVYTNSAPAQADWNGLYILAAEYQPDDIWVARYNSAATIWGLDHKLSNGLTDSTWAEGYRGHQYLNYDTSGAGEVYGGVSFSCPSDCIDRDIEYAQVDGGSGFKTYSYCSTCFADYPNLSFGAFSGINDRGMGQPNSGTWEVVGWIDNSSNSVMIDDMDGTVAEWDVGYGSYANGISNLRQMVGVEATAPGSCYQGGTAEGLYSYPPGQGIELFSYGPGPAPDLGCGPTEFSSINDDGKVTGSYWLADVTKGTLTWTGFTWDRSTGTAGPALAHSGWSDIQPLGINGFGQIVGQYEDSRGNPHAFIEDNGVYTTISACKGSTTSDVWAINNNEQVVGICGSTEFMYDLKNKKITTVYDPSAGSQQPTACKTPGLNDSPINSCAYGINDAAQIAGAVSPAEYELWGFIATPVSTTQ